MKKMLVLLALSAAAWAQPSPKEAVVRVYEIQGPGLQYCRPPSPDWKPGKPEMAGFLLDRFHTDGATVAALELLIGGRIGINKGTEIEILNEGAGGLGLKSGGLWAKFSKQDAPLTIQTRGGTIGIKGTELVVECTPSGECGVELLEGSVEYRDQAGETVTLEPGQKLRQFFHENSLRLLTGSWDEVDDAVRRVRDGQNLAAVRQQLSSRWRAMPRKKRARLLGMMRERNMKRLPQKLQSIVNKSIHGWKPRRPNWKRWRGR